MNTSTKNIAPASITATSTTTSSKYNFLPKFNQQQEQQQQASGNNNQHYNNVNTTQQNQQQQAHHHQSRVFSNDVIDSLANSLSFNRTVSSSSSILSTPSNNIRKYQRQQQQQQQHQQQQHQNNRHNHHHHHHRHHHHYDNTHNHSQPHLKPDTHPQDDNKQIGVEKSVGRISRNGQLIKNKLLNLHQSHKLLQPSTGNNVQQQKTHQATTQLELQHSPRKITHDAEYYTRKVIFGNDTSDSEIDDEENEQVEEDASPIRSIPGYTKGELQLLLKQPTQLNEEDERKLLLEYKRNLMSKQERYFMKSHSLAIRRQVQVSQKKDVLAKMFGDNSMLISEHMTNNTDYSSLDHSFNIHKVLNEDNEEITNLLEEDTWFQASMEEFRTMMDKKKQLYVLTDGSGGEHEFKIAVSDLINKFDSGMEGDDDDAADYEMMIDRNQELYQLGLSHLKAICKQEREESEIQF